MEPLEYYNDELEEMVEFMKNKVEELEKEQLILKEKYISSLQEYFQLKEKCEKLQERNYLKTIPIDRGDTVNFEDAIKKKSLPAVKYYYKKKPSIIHQRIEYITPLFLASRMGCLGIVMFLISKGVDIDQPSETMSPLQEAACSGHLSIIIYLLIRKANINYQDNEGNTSLHYAIYFNHFIAVQLLIEMNANISLVNSEGKTPMQYAIENDRHLIAKYLSS